MTRLNPLLAFLMQRARRRDPGLQGDVAFYLMNDRAMQALNRRFMGKPTPTDVISFRYTVPDNLPETLIGEGFVNIERAARLGPRYGGPAHELALYLAHACDHLSGADDASPEDRRRMRRRELSWLRTATQRNLLTEDLIQA